MDRSEHHGVRHPLVFRLYEVKEDITEIRRSFLAATLLLVISPTSRTSAAFPGHNGKIAYVQAEQNTSAPEIFTREADGSNPKNLTNSPYLDLYPAFSPDGTMIAFLSTRHGNNEIYVMDADGRNPVDSANPEPQRVTENTVSDAYPSFSPDGKRIVFNSFRGGNNDVYVVDLDGSVVPNDVVYEGPPETGP